jgi:ribose-phosphate pyrophosphokinase
LNFNRLLNKMERIYKGSESIDVHESSVKTGKTDDPSSSMVEAGLQDRLKIFSLKSSVEYAKAVASHLRVRLAKHEEYLHPDGESYIRSLENVRRARVFIVADLYSDHEQSVDQKLMKLFWFVGALRDASADDITVVTPYMPYARSDRKVKSREGVLTKYIAEMLESVGVNRILTMDVHNLGAFQNAYRHVHADNLEAKNLLADHIARELNGTSPQDVSVLSVDAGGLGRTRRFRKTLSKLLGGTPRDDVKLAFFDKERGADGEPSGENIVGEVAPVTVIVDDMISTAKSMNLTLNPLNERGADVIFMAATHGLFVGNANNYLANPLLNKIVITDSILPFRLNSANLKKTTVIDTTELFAKAIHNTYTGQSLSKLFE